MISVQNLTKIYKSHIRQRNIVKDVLFRKFKEHTAVRKASFSIPQGEFVGFIGPNGAGKTTTLKILAGILHPTEGSVSVLGQNPFNKDHNFLRQIAFIMGQRNQLVWDLPATDSFDMQKAVYQIDTKQFESTKKSLLEILKCADLVTKPVKTLSLGERMKMELINGLLYRPKIVFLDEPTIGLDIFSQEAIREFIREYQKTYKATVILTSHYLEDVKRLAKRLIIIDRGTIMYDGSLKNIIAQYSTEKRIKVTLDEVPKESDITSIGQPTSFTFPQLVFSVKRSALPEKIKQIATTLSFSDLTVEDIGIEEIVKKFFRANEAGER